MGIHIYIICKKSVAESEHGTMRMKKSEENIIFTWQCVVVHCPQTPTHLIRESKQAFYQLRKYHLQLFITTFHKNVVKFITTVLQRAIKSIIASNLKTTIQLYY